MDVTGVNGGVADLPGVPGVAVMGAGSVAGACFWILSGRYPSETSKPQFYKRDLTIYDYS